MTGHDTKRSKKKPKMNPKAFKKAFSFKQNQQCSQSHHTNGGVSPSAAADTHNRNRRYTSNSPNAVSSSDDDVSTCSSTFETEGNLLIFPTAQRLTASCPPVTIIEGIPGLKHGGTRQQRGDGFLSLGRRRSSNNKTSSYLTSSAPPALQTRSPYQSKKAQKNLSATLKNCRKSNAKHSMDHSAWERRQPTSRSKRSGIIEERREHAVMDIIQTGSSSSLLLLPPEVSPANKFVPIGCEEDRDDWSFHSEDYDICKEPMTEDDIDQPAAPAASIVISTATSVATSAITGKSGPDEPGISDLINEYNRWSHSLLNNEPEKSCGAPAKHYGVIDLPPSPVATDDLSEESFGLLRGISSSPQESGTCCSRDKYCVAPEGGDDDWIGKFTSYFASNCGA